MAATSTLLLLVLSMVVGLAASSSNGGERVTTIITIGDVHGDIEQLTLALQKVGLIDQNAAWTGGATTLVQVGDVLDQGAFDIEAVQLLMRLQQESRAQGGNVVMLLGNHEVYNLDHMFGMTSGKELKREGGVKRRSELLQVGSPVGDFLRNLPAIHVQDGILFVHGGISAQTFASCTSVDMLNGEIRRQLTNAGGDGSNKECASFVKKILHNFDETGRLSYETPWEIRVLPSSSGKVPVSHCKRLHAGVVAANEGLPASSKVDVVVGGHTPHRNWKRRFCERGALFPQYVALDYHFSRYKGGKLGEFTIMKSTASYPSAGASAHKKRKVQLLHYSAGDSATAIVPPTRDTLQSSLVESVDLQDGVIPESSISFDFALLGVVVLMGAFGYYRIRSSHKSHPSLGL